MKLRLVFIIVIVFSFVLAGCSNTSEKTDAATNEAVTNEVVAVEETKSDMSLELNAEELSKFDGKSGDVIYVAVDGIIYDVSHLDLWKGGEHKNGITAGKDLTKEIKEMSPHGIKILERANIVGKLVE